MHCIGRVSNTTGELMFTNTQPIPLSYCFVSITKFCVNIYKSLRLHEVSHSVYWTRHTLAPRKCLFISGLCRTNNVSKLIPYILLTVCPSTAEASLVCLESPEVCLSLTPDHFPRDTAMNIKHYATWRMKTPSKAGGSLT